MLALARLASGLGALGLFVWMATLNRREIQCEVPDRWMPQSALLPYPPVRLHEFARTVREKGLEARYRISLVWLDSAFIVLFASFVCLMTWPRLGVGIPFAVAYAAADFAENRSILRSFDALGETPAGKPRSAHRWTILKFALAALNLLLVLGGLLLVWGVI